MVAQHPHVLGQDVDLLQRAVVQVEAEPDEQPLVRGCEPGLALGGGEDQASRRTRA